MDQADRAAAGQYTISGVLVLALDTTTRGGSVGVLRDDTVLALVDGDGSRTHGERLPGEIDKALVEAGISPRDLELLAVASGPGAFTGLRIGLAAMQGLAMVLGTPVVGVSALDALAESVWRESEGVAGVVTWMDAQRGEVFAASYMDAGTAGGVHGSVPIVAAPCTALAAVPFARDQAVVFAGDGALRYRALISDAWGSRARLVDPVPALAPAVARLGQRLAATGAAGPPHALQPLYVRRPDAERDRKRQGDT